MRPVSAVTGAIICVAVLSAASCSPARQASAGDITSDTVASRAGIARLEAQARALAKSDGCGATSQCRSAPLGVRPCGSPRAYLTYCAATTDSVALFRKLAELKSAELAYNKSAGLMGTCDFTMPPVVVSQGGSCRETTP